MTSLHKRDGVSTAGQRKSQKWSLKKRMLLISGITVGVVASVFIVILSLGNWVTEARNEVPPVRETPFNGGYFAGENTPGEQPTVGEFNEYTESIRDRTKYTFLILGTDGSNTDVIMVATLDTVEFTFDIVNIPRDTMVNVSWNLRKVNSINAYMRARHRGEEDAELKAMDSTLDAFADILGFKVDYWVVVNMRAFVALVDAIGGVDFYVPSRMSYHDPFQNLHIEYSQKMYYGLSGQQSLEILRFRRFANADIGRISVQQSFLKSVAEQILAKRESLDLVNMATIFLNHVVTDIPLNHLVWFGERFLQLEPDNINFHVMPGDPNDSVGGNSYVTIYVDEWLELINEVLNPFFIERTLDDVSILTRGPDRRLYVTDGNWLGSSDWGASSMGSGTQGSTEPSGLVTNSGDSTQGGSSNSPNTETGDDPLNNDDNPLIGDDDPIGDGEDQQDNIGDPLDGDDIPLGDGDTPLDETPDNSPGSEPPIDDGADDGPDDYTSEAEAPQG